MSWLRKCCTLWWNFFWNKTIKMHTVSFGWRSLLSYHKTIAAHGTHSAAGIKEKTRMHDCTGSTSTDKHAILLRYPSFVMFRWLHARISLQNLPDLSRCILYVFKCGKKRKHSHENSSFFPVTKWASDETFMLAGLLSTCTRYGWYHYAQKCSRIYPWNRVNLWNWHLRVDYA